MATQSSAQYVLRWSRRGEFVVLFAIIALFVSLGEASAQEVRSGWEVVDSSTEADLNSAEALDGEIWAFGSEGVMIRSIDGGKTWLESGISINQDLTSSDANFGAIAVAGKRGTVLLMNEGQWFDVSHPTVTSDIKDISLTGNNSFVVISEGSIMTCIVLEGGGADWDNVGSGGSGRGIA